MDDDQPHYLVHNYTHGPFGWVFLEYSEPVEAPDDVVMIEDLRSLIFDMSGDGPAIPSHADIFYCQGVDVRLVGTWERRPGASGEAEMVWHPDDWSERPRSSKEKALRFLRGLGRPA